MTDSTLLNLWLVLCSCLVLIMQAGFICFESGNVRNKNSINVALKNVSDFCVCTACYWAFGYAFMYGTSLEGWIGSDGFLFNGSDNPYGSSFFFFQLMFCCTAATLISGAVAERMRFSGYLLVSVLASACIYPLFGHWAWGSRVLGEQNLVPGWLERLGFIDFAGATVVHSVGGWMALACVIIIGPRLGRFREDSTAKDIFGDNLPLTALGVFLLFLGWFGFNGGSYGRVDDFLPTVFVNTALGGAFGGVVVLFLCIWQRSLSSIRFVLNGLLAGLVGITACAASIGSLDAVIIGGIAGGLSYVATLLLERLRIDDVVGVVPVHLVGGIWGTLAVALFADTSHFSVELSRFGQFGVQLLGVLSCGLFAFILPYFIIMLINKFYPLRVEPRVEILGLNFGEFGLKSEIYNFLTKIRRNRRSKKGMQSVPVDLFTDLGLLEAEYNEFIETINKQQRQAEIARKKLTQLVRRDHLTGLVNRLGFDECYDREWSRVCRERQFLSLMFIDIDHFKAFNDHYGHPQGDVCLKQVAKMLKGIAQRPGDCCARVGGEEFAILLPATDLAASETLAASIFARLEALKIVHEHSPVGSLVTVSIGIATLYPDALIQFDKDFLYRCADEAMYNAKQAGRNCVRSVRVTAANIVPD